MHIVPIERVFRHRNPNRPNTVDGPVVLAEGKDNYGHTGWVDDPSKPNGSLRTICFYLPSHGGFVSEEDFNALKQAVAAANRARKPYVRSMRSESRSHAYSTSFVRDPAPAEDLPDDSVGGRPTRSMIKCESVRKQPHGSKLLLPHSHV